MGTPMDEAQRIIAKLGLAPHPEGGWYRETWRASAAPGTRAEGTAIYYLLEQGQGSHWHRVDAAELWLWHAGSALDLKLANEESTEWATIRLGGDILGGDSAQTLIPANRWQAADAIYGWTLVSCLVVPGFEFVGFEMAAPNWQPGS
jgi:predicted cupin superfamily sugar epimerase